MTFVLSIQTKGSIWLLADRRLSALGYPPFEDARKIMSFGTHDGEALIGYAGLGATVGGTEPSTWISNVLRGRIVSLEQSLQIIADAMSREFVPHLKKFRGVAVPEHNMIISAFVGSEHRLYTIQMALAKTGTLFRFTRHFQQQAPLGIDFTPPTVTTGSGADFLKNRHDWRRPILRLVSAYNDGRIRPETVADHLASLNHDVHRNTSNGTVGPRCLVIWRNVKAGVHKGGGGHCAYNGLARDHRKLILPSIALGMDVVAIAKASEELFGDSDRLRLHALIRGEPTDKYDVPIEKTKTHFAKLPGKPDEKLR